MAKLRGIKIRICEKGFTMTETLLVLFVFTLIWGLIMSSIVSIYHTQGYAIQQSRAIDEARRGVETMSREIREARSGENGAYPIELGAGKQFVFYSDVDDDGQAERVRYFLATVNSNSQTFQCSTNLQGGSCGVTFFDFFTGALTLAQVKISLEGDFGTSLKYAAATADGVPLGNVCQVSGECGRCIGAWQGERTYDVTDQALDNSVYVEVNATNSVRTTCGWMGAHKMRAKFVLIAAEEIPNLDNTLKKGVIQPVGIPAAYPWDQEQVSTVSSYVRNAPPIFSYYDQGGNLLTDNPSILRDTKMMKLLMVINVDPSRPPNDYNLEQYVQMRNLK